MFSWDIKDLEDFDDLAVRVGLTLLQAPEVTTGSWQSTTARSDMLRTYELCSVMLELPITSFQPKLGICTGANLPWAEDHFQERVSGQPLNPPPSEAWWPYAVQGNAEHKEAEQFSHTYPERFWPRFANMGGKCADSERVIAVPIVGIRYEYGDLLDVLHQLRNDISTRQAYLPVWFPEDTGAVSGQRVPCTIGYQFLYRNDKMNMIYTIRSCDFMRHWRDDVYMAGRLLQWVSAELGVEVGTLTMNIGSFHIFQNDKTLLSQKVIEWQKLVDRRRSDRLLQAF